jgi:hypothetical protein
VKFAADAGEKAPENAATNAVDCMAQLKRLAKKSTPAAHAKAPAKKRRARKRA